MHSTPDGNSVALRAHEHLVDAATEAARSAGPQIDARADELREAMSERYNFADRAPVFDSMLECDANRDALIEAAQDIAVAMLTGMLDSTDRVCRNTVRAAALAPLLELIERIACREALRMAEDEVLGESLSSPDIDVSATAPAEVY